MSAYYDTKSIETKPKPTEPDNNHEKISSATVETAHVISDDPKDGVTEVHAEKNMNMCESIAAADEDAFAFQESPIE